MRQWICAFACVLLSLCLAACDDNTVVGVWMPIEPSEYYFELYDDGACVMFDGNDEWISSGTYTAYETYIDFKTDTGRFTWVWDDESESMLFEAGNGAFHYRIKE